MSLRRVSDRSLHQNLLGLRTKEKEIVSEIVNHLREVKKRRLYADHQCPSLHFYCVKILGYSDGEAWSRIKTTELIEEKPELFKKIEDGSLSLTTAAQAKHLFDQGEFSNESKEQVLSQITGVGTREAKLKIEVIAIERGIKQTMSEKSRRQKSATEKVKISITINSSDLENIEFVKSKLNIKDDRDLIKYLVAKERMRLDPAVKVVVAKKTEVASKPRSIAPSKRYQIYKSANSKCENCGSVYALNIEHCRPVVFGGTNELSNLKLLCRSCNLRKAVSYSRKSF